MVFTVNGEASYHFREIYWKSVCIIVFLVSLRYYFCFLFYIFCFHYNFSYSFSNDVVFLSFFIWSFLRCIYFLVIIQNS